jgi:hypothetical protein
MAKMMSRSPELFGINEKAMPDGYVQDTFQHLVSYYSLEKKTSHLSSSASPNHLRNFNPKISVKLLNKEVIESFAREHEIKE